MRVLRTAAGRRALQLGLLVSGLFVLGFLCGEQAHAAEGAPTAVTGRTEVPALPAVPPVHLPTLPPEPTVHLPTVPRLPALPRPPHVPALPTTHLPTLPQLPTPPATPEPAPRPPSAPLPEVPEGTGRPARPSPAPDAPAAPASRPGRNGGTAAAAGPEHRVRTEARTAVGAHPSATAYGPRAPRAAARAPEAPARAAARPARAPVALPAGAPASPRPTGDPDGVLGKRAADAPAPRHGDGRAVAPEGRTPLWLRPARTAARADAPRTRERHRDVPVFPG
ncbi:hypothetical protein [Streptomyces collinus]|uniref:hypothetical protein n=1 Tax=Streptomyces collinus TaxID=42684 RepID=UPI003686BE2B